MVEPMPSGPAEAAVGRLFMASIMSFRVNFISVMDLLLFMFSCCVLMDDGTLQAEAYWAWRMFAISYGSFVVEFGEDSRGPICYLIILFFFANLNRNLEFSLILSIASLSSLSFSRL